MHKTQNHLALNRIVLILIFFYISFIWFTGTIKDFAYYSGDIFFSFILNGIIAGSALISSLSIDGMSLRVMFYFFNTLFFFLIPFTQYLTNQWLFLDKFNNLFYANLIITLWLILFYIGYSIGFKKFKNNNKNKYESKILYRYKPRKISFYVSCICSLLIFAWIFRTTGITGLILRSKAGVVQVFGGWGPLALVAQYYLRPMAFFFALISIYFFKEKIKLKSLILLPIIIGFLLNFPLSVARFYAFSIVFSVMLMLLKPSYKNASIYFLTLIISTTASNIIGSFRHAESLTEIALENIKINFLSFFLGSFDAYENFVHSIHYVDLNGLTWGRQLLGVLLFWFPRELWVGKPIGTGAFIAQEYLHKFYNVTNDNLSAPLIEELYVNFHLPSVCLGIIAFSFVLGVLDYGYKKYRFLRVTKKIEIIPFYSILYPVLIGFLLFVLRGDGLSSFAYLSGTICAYLTLRLVLLKKYKILLRI